MAEANETPVMHWVYRHERSVLVARQEPLRPASGWVFDQTLRQPINPERDLKICSTSTHRDDPYNHAGFRLSDNKWLFSFKMGRTFKRVLTAEEQTANPHYDCAYICLIVDNNISRDERQLVLEWLQATEDCDVISTREAGRPREHALMNLKSVNSIEGS